MQPELISIGNYIVHEYDKESYDLLMQFMQYIYPWISNLRVAIYIYTYEEAKKVTFWYRAIYDYSGTPLNGHPCTTAICFITAKSSGPDWTHIDLHSKRTPVERPPRYLV